MKVCVKPTTFRRKGRTIKRRRYCYNTKDRGKRGRGPKLIEISKSGALVSLGYSARAPLKKRRAALKKAVRKYGPTTVYKMLNAQYVLRKRVQRDLGETFRRDRNWVKREFMS